MIRAREWPILITARPQNDQTAYGKFENDEKASLGVKFKHFARFGFSSKSGRKINLPCDKTWCKDAINLSFTKEKSKCLILCFYMVVWVC